MSHEVGETIERDGKWFNVYGHGLPKAGQPLPRVFPFERESYSSEQEASRADQRRSFLTDPHTEQPYTGSALSQRETEWANRQDSFTPDSFTPDAANPTAPKAVSGPTQAERAAYATANVGTPEGQKTRKGLAEKYGPGLESMLDPAGAWMGKHVMPQVPYFAIPGGPVPRMAGSAIVGAATAPEGHRIKGAIKGVLGQAVGEAVGPAVTVGAQRLTGRAVDRISDQIATKLVEEAKRIVPWFGHLPEGQAGFRALMKEGQEILTTEYGDAMRKAGGVIPPTAEAIWKEGKNLLNALKAVGALDQETKRLNPEKLVKGMAKTFGVKNPKTIWDQFLTMAKAPRVRAALTPLHDMPAPEKVRIGLPFVSQHVGEMRVGEHLPWAVWSRNVPPSAAEASARRLAPVAAGSVAREAENVVSP